MGKELKKNKPDVGTLYFGYGYDIEKKQTKEQFIRYYCSLFTFAVIKNGEWIEKGEMGWWGMVKDGKENKEWENIFEELMIDVTNDTSLVLVDYHAA